MPHLKISSPKYSVKVSNFYSYIFQSYNKFVENQCSVIFLKCLRKAKKKILDLGLLNQICWKVILNSLFVFISRKVIRKKYLKIKSINVMHDYVIEFDY